MNEFARVTKRVGVFDCYPILKANARYAKIAKRSAADAAANSMVDVKKPATTAAAAPTATASTAAAGSAGSAGSQANGTGTGPTTSGGASVLEKFFPFDPYLLKKSNSVIENLYLKYTHAKGDRASTAYSAADEDMKRDSSDDEDDAAEGDDSDGEGEEAGDDGSVSGSGSGSDSDSDSGDDTVILTPPTKQLSPAKKYGAGAAAAAAAAALNGSGNGKTPLMNLGGGGVRTASAVSLQSLLKTQNTVPRSTPIPIAIQSSPLQNADTASPMILGSASPPAPTYMPGFGGLGAAAGGMPLSSPMMSPVMAGDSPSLQPDSLTI